MFILHERLKADTFKVCNMALCQVLLMNDTTYPWLILVPRQNDIVEITDLTLADQALLMVEMSKVSAVLQEMTDADKMNVAALGNMVPQLHMHVIARFKDDPSWPNPVWGKTEAIAYGENIKNEFLKALSEKLT
ncbi:MAG: diadenosine tetraphosphate (Ap4A) HIT family hydrolase [Alphaproteobacteria bacterium]|jgi:diadenosine tetraphosphate (Ap4A) HIT family hydrolase